jgi:hypothetical protein
VTTSIQLSSVVSRLLPGWPTELDRVCDVHHVGDSLLTRIACLPLHKQHDLLACIQRVQWDADDEDSVFAALDRLEELFDTVPEPQFLVHVQKNTSEPNKESLRLWQSIHTIATDPNYDDMSLTVRQVYYQCVTRHFVPENTKGQYRRVQRAILQMRRQGHLPWWKIRDSLRERKQYAVHDDARAALDKTAREYRRDVMRFQQVHIELWIEKDSLIGWVSDLAEEFGLHFAAMRGFSSDSFQYDAAEAWRQIRKPVFVLYAGDFDPGGVFMTEQLEQQLRCFYSSVSVWHIGLREDQVRKLRLPPSFEVKATDTRGDGFAQRFGTQCTELDAVPPDVLRGWYRDAIVSCVDRAQLEDEWERQKHDRVLLQDIVRQALPALPPPTEAGAA